MIILEDIKREYIKKLRKNFAGWKIYGTEVTEGYERPSFFVRIMQGAGLRENRSTWKTEVTLETTVFLERKDEAAGLEATGKIESMMRDYLYVNGQMLPVTGFEQRYAGKNGDIPMLDIQIEFLQDIREKETEPVMQTMKLKEGLKDGNAIH